MRAGIAIYPIVLATLTLGCGSASNGTSGHDGGADAAACAPDGTKTFDAQHVFTFRAPCTLQAAPQKGADSLVGEYTDTGLVLDYDYGGYSSDLTEYQSWSSYEKQTVVVGGKSGYIVTAVDPGPDAGLAYMAGLYVPSADSMGDKLSFIASCDSAARQSAAVAILKTVAF